jgi:hypothetical protein
MKRSYLPLAFGALLVGAGVLLLLQNFGVLTFGWDLIWSLLFALGGAAFVAVFLKDREQWWAIIPGFTLLGIGGLIGLAAILPESAGAWGGTFFLGAISLAFWVIYALRRENWWAVIPGGVLLTLAVVAGLAEAAGGIATGGLFFLGLAATFGLVYLLPTPEGRMKWAIIPAGILGAMGVLIILAATSVVNYLWPLALILAGLYLVYRSFFSRRA